MGIQETKEAKFCRAEYWREEGCTERQRALESCRDFLSNLQLSADERICARKLPEPGERKWDNPWSSHMLVVVYVSTSQRGKILVIHVTSDRVLRKALILRT